MAELPYIVLSCATSLDGYLDDRSGQRLILSTAADLDRVDALRATCDAILVGAGTVRADNPRLVVRSPERRAWRVAEGRAPTPCKVTVTGQPTLDPAAAVFAPRDGDTLVYCASPSVGGSRERLGAVATVVDAGESPTMSWVGEDLAARGVRRLMVEGGQSVLTQFLALGLADELQLVVAPFFVADSGAHRVVADGPLPFNRDRRARLAEVRQIDDVVVLRYALSARFEQDDPEGPTT